MADEREMTHAAEGVPLATIWGEPVQLSEPGKLVHLQFRCSADSPGCALHLRDFNARREEIWAAGVEEVVVFHSRTVALRAHHGDLPFAVVADPNRLLYREFAVLRRRRGDSLPADFLIDERGRVLVSRQGHRPYDQWSVDDLLAVVAEQRLAFGE